MDFEIQVEPQPDDTYLVSLAGEVDLYAAPEFKQQLLQLIDQGAERIVVDLSSVTFLDSTTLGVIVGALRRLRDRNGDLSIVCIDRNILRVFDITGLDRAFDLHGARQDALARLPSPVG
jgi:anti-sigma B factor antagonist